jgi:hypothetical protein
LARRNRDRVAAAASIVPWRRDHGGWPDYDLISGPAGTLLSLASNRLPGRRSACPSWSG